MYQIIECSDYNDFLTREKEIREAHYSEARKTGHAGILYRGQGDCNWDLEASLFRNSADKNPNIETYLRSLLNDRRLIDGSINRPNLNEEKIESVIKSIIDKAGSVWWPLDDDIMEWLKGARHYGLHSPLLDWTNCLFVASYFAYSGVVDASIDLAIFMKTTSNYSPGEGVMDGDELIIYETDSPRSTIQRDKAQKSSYSVSYLVGQDEKSYTFYNAKDPEEIVKYSSLKTNIYQFILPVHDKSQILQHLDDNYNINYASLMPTDSPSDIFHD